MLAVPALAEDRMVMKHLEPKQTKTISFEASKGAAQIVVVSSTPSELFTCKLIDDQSSSVKENTNKCEFSLNLKEPSTLKLNLINNSDSPVDCRASFTSK